MIANRALALAPVFQTETPPGIGTLLAFVWLLVSGRLVPALPGAGAAVDGATLSDPSLRAVALRTPGAPIYLTAAAPFGANVDLETDATGKVLTAGAGVKIARSLEVAAGSGSVVLCVFR